MKEDKVIQWETFITKNSWKIQMIIIVATIVIETIVGMNSKNVLNFIVTLLASVIFELMLLSTQNSASNRRLISISNKMRTNKAEAFVIFDFKPNQFFKNTVDHFFISGISLGNFFEDYLGEIDKLLKDKKKVFVLFSAPETISENIKYYCANHLDEKRLKEDIYVALAKQITAISNILSIKNVEQYLERGKLNIGLSKAVISTSFIANDVLSRADYSEKEIAATFYQYNCNNTKSNPGILISLQEEKWYQFFKKILQKQWGDAEKIKNLTELQGLREKIEILKSSYKV